MSQHDYVIGNQLFPETRADLNAALQAILTQNSGPSEPAVFSAGTFWYDTVAEVLKRRNDSNTAWVAVASVDLTPEQVASIIDQLGDLATKDTVGVGDIDAGVVGTAELSDGAATLDKLASNSVDATKVIINSQTLDKLVQAGANVLLGRRTTSGNVAEVPYSEAGYAVLSASTAPEARVALGILPEATRELLRRPTLDIDPNGHGYIKRNNQAQVRELGITNNSFATLSRATTSMATNPSGLLYTASSETPTLNYPSVTLAGGLGIFRAATNNVLWSQDTSNAWWVKTGLGAPVVNIAGAPDGTATGNRLTCDSSTGVHSLVSSLMTGLTSADHQGFSFYIKRNNHNRFKAIVRNGTPAIVAEFDIDLSSGVPVISGVDAANVIVRPQAGSSGYYRVEVYTGVILGATSATVELFFLDSSGATSWTSAGTEAVDVWGFQQERYRPTPYIGATTGTALTRNKDDYDILCTEEWYGSPAGYTIYMETSFDFALIGSANAEYRRYLFTLQNTEGGSTTYHDAFVYGNTGQLSVTARNNSDTATLHNTGLIVPSNEQCRMAFSYRDGNLHVALNGATATTARVINPAALGNLVLGANVTNSRHLNAPLSRFTFWPMGITQAQAGDITR